MVKKFRFRQFGLAGDVYYDQDVKPRGTALCAYGLPAFIGPNDAIESLVKAGYVTLQPHYRGTYDSDGEFSPESIQQTYSDLWRIVNSGGVTNASTSTFFKLPALPSISVGHSFGALCALRAAKQLPSVQHLILLAPAVHYGRAKPDFGLKEDGPSHFEYLRSAWPHTHRLGSNEVWAQITKGEDPLPNEQPHPSIRDVTCVIGRNDKYFDVEAVKRNLETAVRAYVGDRCQYSLSILEGAGHYLDELVERSPYFSLRQVASHYLD